jgi:hypothetical protein
MGRRFGHFACIRQFFAAGPIPMLASDIDGQRKTIEELRKGVANQLSEHAEVEVLSGEAASLRLGEQAVSSSA